MHCSLSGLNSSLVESSDLVSSLLLFRIFMWTQYLSNFLKVERPYNVFEFFSFFSWFLSWNRLDEWLASYSKIGKTMREYYIVGSFLKGLCVMFVTPGRCRSNLLHYFLKLNRIVLQVTLSPCTRVIFLEKNYNKKIGIGLAARRKKSHHNLWEKAPFPHILSIFCR